MRVTLREIAHRAGVHYATASHVLNGARGSTHVSEATRRRVLQVASDLGYSANRAAQQLRTRRSRVVGLLTGGIENPFFARMVSLCSEALEAQGYDVVLATRRRDEASDLHLLEALTSRQLDGILLWSETNTQVRERLQKADMSRVVMMGFEMPGRDGVSAVLDNAIEAGLRHLIEQGCQRIAYCAPSVAVNRIGDPRHVIYRRVLAEANLPTQFLPYEGTGYDVAAARENAERLAKTWQNDSNTRPDALFCMNDLVAFGTMMGLRRQGLRVPDDVALLGCDDLPLAAQLDVPLSTIAYPLADVCQEAVNLLLSRIEAEVPRREVANAEALPHRFVKKEATLILRASSQLREQKEGQ